MTRGYVSDEEDWRIETERSKIYKPMNDKKFMAKLFSSRTNWTILIMFLIGGVSSIHGMVGDWVTLVEGILGVLAMYFKMNPSQSYGK